MASASPPKPSTLPLRAQHVPAELCDLPRWLPGRWEHRKGKWTKPPYQISGEFATSTDPATWTTFEAVLSAYEAGGFDGTGFVLTADDPYAGVDLDHCHDPETGETAPWAAEIITELDSYTEISPSGTGIRIIVKGKLPGGRRKHGDVEMYDSARYLTITGHILEPAP